jgi:hypothetical protein
LFRGRSNPRISATAGSAPAALSGHPEQLSIRGSSSWERSLLSKCSLSEIDFMPAAAEQAAGFFCQLYKSLALHLSDKV